MARNTVTSQYLNGSISLPSAFTLFMRLSSPQTSSTAVAFETHSGSTSIFSLTSGELRVYRSFSTTQGKWSAGNPTWSAENTLAIRHDGTTAAPSVRLNGSNRTISQTQAPSGTVTTGASTAYVLNGNTGSNPWGGTSKYGCDYAIYNRVLSDSEVDTLASGHLIQSGLVYAWRMAGSTSPEPNLIGGVDLTVTGATSATDPSTIFAVPSATSGLTATPSGSTVALAWTSQSDATTYTVQRSPGGAGSWSTIATPSTNSYSDTGLANGTYDYRVAATNQLGTGSYSSTASATVNVAAGSSATPDGYSQRLDVVLTDSNGRRVAANATVTDLDFKTNQNGFADCTIQYAIDPFVGYQLYSLNTVWECKVMDGGATIYHGRVEDVKLNGSSMQVTAFGYYRALSDLPYTALWSTYKLDNWHAVKGETYGTGHKPERYTIDTNNGRLGIAPKKNAQYGNNNDQGAVDFYIPNGSSRNIVAVAFDYTLSAYAGMRVRLQSYSNGTLIADEWTPTIPSAFTRYSGSVVQAVSSCNRLMFVIDNNSGSTATFTAEEGTAYLHITNMRVVTQTLGASIDNATVAADMVTTIAATNSNQISTSTSLINSTGVGLTEAVYEDANMADVLQQLADQGDSSGNKYEVGVYLNKQLYFRQKGSAGRTWYVDIDELDLERTIDTLVNSAYTSYKDANDVTVRSSISADSASIARYGLTRRSYVQIDTTSSTQATAARTALLTDQASPLPKARISFSHVYNANGGQYPLYFVRAGDSITIRNLPPNLGSNVDRIRTFRISETSYNASSNTLDVTPEAPLPTLDRVLAQTA